MSDARFLQNGFDKRLSHFIEECGEALAAAGKTQRWGATSYNPLLPAEQREMNITWLRREIGDVLLAADRLLAAAAEDFNAETLGDSYKAMRSSSDEAEGPTT